MPKIISDITLIVHPFYTLGVNRRLPDSIQKKRLVRKNLDFLLGLWGKKIKQAAENPNAVVVLVHPYHLGENLFESRVLAWENFARRTLGKRLIEARWHISERRLQSELRQRGFSIDRAAFRGKAFGEWFAACVDQESRCLAKALGVPKTRINQIAELSLIGMSGSRTGILGNMLGDNLRKRAMKIRRRKGKAVRKKLRIPA